MLADHHVLIAISDPGPQGAASVGIIDGASAGPAGLLSARSSHFLGCRIYSTPGSDLSLLRLPSLRVLASANIRRHLAPILKPRSLSPLASRAETVFLAMAATHTRGQRHDRIGDSIDGQQTLGRSRLAHASDISLGQRMLSAVSGSILTSLLVTPLDVVRVRLQAQQGPSPTARLPSFLHLPPDLGVTACCREVFWVQNQSQFCVAAPTVQEAAVLDSRIVSDCAAEETQRRTFTSTLDGLKKIARNEGIWTLWRGLSPTLLMTIPANVIYFAGYDWLRSSPRSPMAGRVSDTYAPLAAGSAARVMAAIAVSPIEMLRTRMQATRAGDKSVLRATVNGLKEMVGSDGYLSLWRGLTLTMWRDVPFSALYWWGYEYGRQHLNEVRARSNSAMGRPNRTDITPATLLADSFMAGAASGAVAALVTTPFDVGKTRQQTVLQQGDALANRPESRTMPRFLWHIYTTEGTRGLFKGWAARCLKVAPACAIMISTYEVGKQMAIGTKDRQESGPD